MLGPMPSWAYLCGRTDIVIDKLHVRLHRLTRICSTWHFHQQHVKVLISLYMCKNGYCSFISKGQRFFKNWYLITILKCISLPQRVYFCYFFSFFFLNCLFLPSHFLLEYIFSLQLKFLCINKCVYVCVCVCMHAHMNAKLGLGLGE